MRTSKDFLALPEADGFVELIDGEIIASGARSPAHQRVLGNIVYYFSRALRLKGKYFIARVAVLLDDLNVVEPDIIYLAPDSRCRVTKTHLVGAPDLLVEIYSPRTVKRDKLTKFRLYQQHGVREYWIADPEARYLEAWSLVEGAYKYIGAFAAGEGFDSVVLAQRVDVSAIFLESESSKPSDQGSTPI